jgi:hypothetical protein
MFQRIAWSHPEAWARWPISKGTVEEYDMEGFPVRSPDATYAL